MRNIARGVSLIFVSQLARMVAKGGLIIVLTRYLLEPAAYGQLFLTLSVLGFLLLFSNLGLGKSGGKYITEYREKSPEIVPTIIKSTLFYRLIAIIVICAVVYVFHGRIAAIVGESSIDVLLLFGVGYIAVKSLTGVSRMFFQGLNRMDLVAVTTIVPNVILIVAVPLLIILDYGLVGAISGYTISYGIGAVVGLTILYTKFYADYDVSTEDKKGMRKRILRYSVPLSLTMGANVLNSRIDTILLSVFRGPTAIAFYTLGKQIADFLIAPANSLGFGISPAIGEQKANDDLTQAASLYERSLIYTLTLYGPAAAGVVVVASPSIRYLFGTEYTGAAPVLQIFSLFVLVRAIDSITSDTLDYLGRARSRAVAKGVLAIGNVALNLVLIPPFGVIGATVATVITYTLYVSTELFIVSDELPLDRRRLLRSGTVVSAITAGMLIIVYPLAEYISSIISLVGVICVGGGIWIILTEFSGIVDIRRLSSVFR